MPCNTKSAQSGSAVTKEGITIGVWVGKKKGKDHLGYWVFVRHKNKRRSKLVGDKKDAEKLAKEYRLALARNDLHLNPQTTSPLLSTYFPDWLATHAKPQCKPSTYSGYEIAWRLWIAPAIGQKRLDEITRADVRQIIATMERAGKSRPYIKGTLAPLSAVFNRGIDDEFVTKNPAVRIMPKQRGQAAQAARPLTREQLRHLLTTAQTHFPDCYPFVLLFARAGLRIGEAVALQIKHVDFAHQCLWVVRNWVKGRIQTPKSGKQRRVDMSDQLSAVLRTHVTGKAPDALVFSSRAGTVVQPDNFRRRAWTHLFLKAGLPRIRVHDLRHTYASLLIQQGAPLGYVKEQMGHHSISVTMDIYGHLVPGGNRVEVNKLDEPRGVSWGAE